MGTVLLVDDDVNLLTMFARVLSNREHHVITTTSAEEALTCLTDVRPEVIVMDFSLPGMNGLEAFIALKTSAANIPVIIMTGESSMSIAVEAAALGVFDFHVKPFEPKLMIEAIERAAASCRDADLPPSTAPTQTIHEGVTSGVFDCAKTINDDNWY